MFAGKEEVLMREAWKCVRICIMAAAFLLLLGVGVNAQAAPAQVQGLYQASGSASSVKVKWDALIADGIRYKVELSEDIMFSGGKTEERSNTESNFYGLSSGRSYFVRVTAFTRENGEEVYGTPSRPLEVVTVPERSSTQNLRQTAATTTSITVKWEQSPGANAYRLEYFKSGDTGNRKVVPLGNVLTYTASNLSKDSEYAFYVYPERKSTSGYQASSDLGYSIFGCPVLPGKVEGLTPSFSSPTTKYMELSWDRRNSADGYQYEIYSIAGKKAKKLISDKKDYNGSMESVMSNKLVKPQFLKVRVRAYVVLGSGTRYGAWSGWKYISKQPEIKISNVSGGQRISWKKVGGADSYTLYVSSKRENGYKKVKTLSKNSMTVKKYGRSALKSGKTYYYTVVANKKIGRKTYKGSKTHCYSRVYFRE